MDNIINGVTCIKGEISSIMTLMRLNTRWSGHDDIRYYGYHDEDPLVLAFRRLNIYLEGIYDMREVDCLMCVIPFHHVIVSDKASGPLTQAALSSLSKFVLYGLFSPNFPRALEGISLIAKCISNCIFEETDWESDEVIFMKLLELSALTIRCDASSLLTVSAAWDIYSTCLNIHAQPRGSKILKSEAETALRDLTLTAFSWSVKTPEAILRCKMPGFGSENNIVGNDETRKSDDKGLSFSNDKFDDENLQDALRADKDELLDQNLWREASAQLFLSTLQGVKALLCKIMNTLSCKMDLTEKKHTSEGVIFALSLINVALEAGGPALGNLTPLVNILRADICRHLLRASQSEDLGVLSLSFRVVFNLFVSIKDHMKVQLEVFLTSVHLRLLRRSANSSLGKDSSAKLIAFNMAREELVLESLLEFCHEPNLMIDLYTNYDCDVTCTNLFHSIIDSLCTRAFMPTDFSADHSSRKTDPASMSTAPRLHILNRLALDGVFAILHSVATRIDNNAVVDEHTFWNREITLQPSGDDHKESEAHSISEYTQQPLRSESVDSLVSIPLQHYASANFDENVERLNHGSPRSPPVEAESAFLNQSGVLDQSCEISTFVRPDSPIASASRILSEENRSYILDAEALRQRKLYKQQLRLIADQFNDRPLKPDWLRLAVTKQLIEAANPDGIMLAEQEDAATAIAFAAALEKGAKPPTRVDKADRALSSIGDARSVAQFLKNTHGLGKAQVGEFIGKGPAEAFPFHKAVLVEYVKTFSFPPGYGFAESLRVFLGHFRMPGEAQCIDRLLEAFAAHLFNILGKGNPFNSADAVFILAFSTIMLNTDLHNKNHNKAHKKMTLEEFLRNNRDINDGKALPREYLTSLYNDIRDRQIQLDVDIQDEKAVDITGMSDATNWKALLHKSAADQAPAVFTSTFHARQSTSNSAKRRALQSLSIHERDIFLVMAEPVLEAIQNAWNGARGVDDMLMSKLISGVADYASICVSLGLRHILTSLLEMLSNTAKSLLEQPAHLTELLRIGQSEENGYDIEKRLAYLLGLGFENCIRQQVHARTGTAVLSDDKEEFKVEHAKDPWDGARFVRGELALRMLFFIVEMYRASLDQQAWAGILQLLLWVRQRGSLSPVLSHFQDNASYWGGQHRDLRAEHLESVRGDALKAANQSKSTQTSFARSCHRRARGVHESYSSSTGKGLLSAFTGILFGTVTLTERADGVQLDTQVQALDGNSCAKSRMDSHALLSRIALIKATLVHGRAGLILLDHSFAQDSVRAHLIATTLSDSLLDALEDRIDAMIFNARKASVESSTAASELTNGISSSEGSASIQRSTDAGQELETSLLIEWVAHIMISRLLMDEHSRKGCALSFLKNGISIAGKPVLETEVIRPLSGFECQLGKLFGVFLRIYESRVCDFYPYLVERMTGLVLRVCMILVPTYVEVYSNHSHNKQDPIWECLHYISELPRHFISQIACYLGKSASTLIRHTIFAEFKESSAAATLSTGVQWHALLSLLSAATAGTAGRAPAWEGLCLVLDHRPLVPVSFAACRVLLLRFLYTAFADSEDDDSVQSEPNMYMQTAMDRLMGLCAMLIGGHLRALLEYTPQHQVVGTVENCDITAPAKKDGSFNEPSQQYKLFTAATGYPMVTFQLPRVGGREQIFLSPTKSSSLTNNPITPELVLDNIAVSGIGNSRRATPPSRPIASGSNYEYSPKATPTNQLPFAEPPKTILAISNISDAPPLVYQVRLAPGGFELTVPTLTLPFAETEQLWLDTVRRLAEQAGNSEITLASAAVYNLQAVLGFGKAVTFSADTWISVLQNLVTKLPLQLSRYGVNNYLCLHCCNVVFELLVSHIVSLRRSLSLYQPWLRFCQILSENVSLSFIRDFFNPTAAFNVTNSFLAIFFNQTLISQNKGSAMSSTLNEMLEMIAALLRLLRMPTLVSASLNVSKVAKSSSSKSTGLLSWFLGGSDDEESDLSAPDPSQENLAFETQSEHDAELLLKSWEELCRGCPSLTAILKKKNVPLVTELETLALSKTTQKTVKSKSQRSAVIPAAVLANDALLPVSGKIEPMMPTTDVGHQSSAPTSECAVSSSDTVASPLVVAASASPLMTSAGHTIIDTPHLAAPKRAGRAALSSISTINALPTPNAASKVLDVLPSIQANGSPSCVIQAETKKSLEMLQLDQMHSHSNITGEEREQMTNTEEATPISTNQSECVIVPLKAPVPLARFLSAAPVISSTSNEDIDIRKPIII